MHPTQYGGPPAGDAEPAAPRTIALPPAALRLGVLAPFVTWFAGGIGGAFAFALGGRAASILAASSVAISAATYAVARTISRRYGTGNVWRDLAIYARPFDVVRALGFTFVTQVVVVIVTIGLQAVSEEIGKTNLSSDTVPRGAAAIAVLTFTAVIVAPLVEETVFRGLLLQALRSRVATPVAVVLQALAFGLVHLGAFGLGNIGIFTGTTVIGLILGIIAVRDGRLGTAMLTHGMFNAASLAVTYST